MSDSSDTPPRRPRAAALLLAAPIVAGVGLLVATVGWWLTVQGTRGEAAGGEAILGFEAACDAGPTILARLEEYGLKAGIEPDGRIRTQLPGADDDLDHLPRALAAPGSFEVRVDGQTRHTRFDRVGVQISLSGAPISLVMLPEALPESGVEVLLDGAPVEVEGAMGGLELQIPARAKDSRTALRLATDRVVALRHPLACAVRPTGAERAG